MEIKIENYLNHEEIKEVVTDELRNQIRSHFKSEENAKRLLSNLAYHIVMEEIDKIVPNYHSELVDKVKKLINEKDLNFHVYNFDTYRDGRAISVGAKIIEETVKEQKVTIKQIVIDTIKNKDYSQEAWNKFERLAEDFTSNIYDFVEEMRKKN